jgi:hypothetical protein
MGTKLGTKLGLACLVATVAFAGCGGGGSNDSLSGGVYEQEITEQFLLDHEFTAEHAAGDSGHHEIALSNGSFTDTWTGADKETRFCSGTYKDESGSITFTWISGCFGDWSGRYTIDGDTVTWSDVKALPPYDDKESQRQAEVFAVPPWTRTSDAPGS